MQEDDKSLDKLQQETQDNLVNAIGRFRAATNNMRVHSEELKDLVTSPVRETIDKIKYPFEKINEGKHKVEDMAARNPLASCAVALAGGLVGTAFLFRAGFKSRRLRRAAKASVSSFVRQPLRTAGGIQPMILREITAAITPYLLVYVARGLKRTRETAFSESSWLRRKNY